MALSIDLFDYDLPAHLIAQKPSETRDQSKLLVVNRKSHSVSHHKFADIGSFIHPGDTFIRNSVSVLPARLEAQRPTGGKVECFLLHPGSHPDGLAWWCLVKPGRKLPVGAQFRHDKNGFAGTIIEKAEDGTSLVRFEPAPCFSGVREMANACGQVPLPPYIERGSGPSSSEDLDRYQTVYANRARQNAVAAPTAGLHFTPELIQSLEQQGATFRDVILHVGLGTFRPVSSATVEGHDIHKETYEIPTTTQEALLNPGSGRRIAIGTTSVRASEDFLRKNRTPCGHDYVGEASIYLYPPARFNGIDALVTNFHQPRSTLLCLVSAFLAQDSTDGIGWLREIYAEAIRKEYRFFSYGDAMLIT